MTEKDKPRKGAGDGDAQKKRLIQRLGVAAVLIAALLAGLALFERGELQETATAPMTQPPVLASQFARGQVQPVAQVLPEPPAPAAAAEAAPPAGEAATPPAPPTEAPEPDAVAPGRKVVLTPGKTGEHKQIHPVAARPAAESAHVRPPAEPVRSRPAAEPSPIRPVAAASAPLAAAASAAVPALASPSAPVLAARPTPAQTAAAAVAPQASAAVSPVPRSAPAGYMVQVGAYVPVGDAEALRAKLALSGIPALLEARVRAGPFASREEAATARAKIKAMGLEASILLPFHH